MHNLLSNFFFGGGEHGRYSFGEVELVTLLYIDQFHLCGDLRKVKFASFTTQTIDHEIENEIAC